ncbi:unnamed protein product [Rodentolepis nana]|uniref:E3 ubiquitin-protein ligase n=1 Tax=Rodentolepis nana TaxID=102285 RepID=A0A0R3TB68_RODNA|nr:unnamed protein product [Rodentolepis nana]
MQAYDDEQRDNVSHGNLASQHLIPAIWEAAFCTYLAKYLTPGWLKESTYNGSGSLNGASANLPKIIVTERRRSSRLRSTENGSTSSTPNTTTDSHSDVFASPIQRPRQLHTTSGGIDSDHTAPSIAYLPLFSHLREMLTTEAELVMNEAVLQSLSVSALIFTLIRSYYENHGLAITGYERF